MRESSAIGDDFVDSDVFPFGKPQYRERLRNIPLPEKVRIVVELQKIAAPILRARGENPFVWQIGTDSENTPLT